MSESTAVQFRGVTKEYASRALAHVGAKGMLMQFPDFLRQRKQARFVALRDVSFEIKRGERFAMIGVNGAGKSTTLALIARVMLPTLGTIETHGHVCPLLELGAGFHPDLSGRENITLNGVLLGMTRREVKAKLDRILDFAGLGTFIDEPLRTYSAGMSARLGFAVAVHLDPDILLIDEILAVGDAAFQKKCLDRINEFHKRGVTFVMVSHDSNMVRSTCDRAVLLNNGSVHLCDRADRVVDEYHRLLEGPPVATPPPAPTSIEHSPSEGKACLSNG
ncbi:MAG: ABC transporter ATP-binding protein [Phycisphaerales bacterium]|nr:ABC transporter ATP-binding protein [Phycisphaerales bacterium]